MLPADGDQPGLARHCRELHDMAANRSIAPPPAQRVYLSPAQVAVLLGIPVKTIYTWNCEGTGPRFMKLGRHVRYLEAEVHAWAEAHFGTAA